MSEIRRRVSYTQLLHLWEFLNKHREIAVGYNKSTQARDHSKQMWLRAAEILNSTGDGAIKSGSEWSKYWVDLKAKLKRKNRMINDSRRRTGGGPATELDLSEIDKKILSILGEDYGSGLPGVQVIPRLPLVSQEYEENVAGPSNPGISQSTGSEEPIYLVVQDSEEYQQSHPTGTVESVASLLLQTPVGGNEPDPTDSQLTQSTPQPTRRPRHGVLPVEADPPASPSRHGVSGQTPSRCTVQPVEADQLASPSRRGTSVQGPRRRLVLDNPPPLSPRPDVSGERRRRRRRQARQMSAVDARERLVISTEKRAQAELANSRSIERAVNLLGDIVSVLRNIQDKI